MIQTVKGCPCYLTRYASFYSGNSDASHAYAADQSVYSAAVTALNSYDMATIPWGSTYNQYYGTGTAGLLGNNTTNYWQTHDSLLFLPPPPSPLAPPVAVAFSRAALLADEYISGSLQVLFQLQRVQVLLCCGDLEYNVSFYDWTAGFQPAPWPTVPTSCSDATTPANGDKTILDITLPSDAGTLPTSILIVGGQPTGEAVAWKLLNLGALCS